MRKCKKYRPNPGLKGHHMGPGGSCEACVYFSKMNCGAHGLMAHGANIDEHGVFGYNK